ncbi:MAG: glycosyltransferase family 4 protein [Candidatus Pacebacteria bacterium]|nr:glycosyltransferase family 4 protein [Candidatus Paceibacterota bacterium]
MITKREQQQGDENNETTSLPNKDRALTSNILEEPIRIAIVVSHPIQYFTPWYRAIAATAGVVLKVFFCSKLGAESYYDKDFGTDVKWDIPLLEGYDSEYLESARQVEQINFWIDNPTVGAVLERFQPDVVLVQTYSYRTIWRAVRWCNRKNIPVMLYSDSNWTAKRSMWKCAAKEIVVRKFYSQLDGAFSCGDNNRIYHLHYGIPENRVFEGTLPVDCRRLVASVGDEAATRQELRKQYGIPDDAFVVTYTGKLTSNKCPLHLLEAIYRCSRQGVDVWGLLVGEGVERPAIEAFVKKHEMKTIVLAGFINQSVVGKYYAASDAVVLMSYREAKGLPVPEAGCFGCPAILSDTVGCIGPTDSARLGENALAYPWGDTEAMANCILRMYRDQKAFRAMSEAAVRIANLQDVSVAARQLKDAAIQLKNIGCR